MMARSISYRIRRTEELRRAQEEAINSTIFILKEFGPTSFLLQDENQKTFRVYIGQEHSCTCNEFKVRRELCIHICWVMLKRFKVDRDDSVGWQLGLVEREIMDILDGKHSRVSKSDSKPKDANDDPGAQGDMEANGEIRQRQIGPDDVCAICQDELLGEQRHPVTYCRRGCGNSVHIRCMRVWTDHQRKQKSINLSETVPCPICREDFGQLGILLREITENTPPRGGCKANRKSAVVAPVIQSIQPIQKAEHPGTVCMCCQANPIYGKIYRCQLCEAELGTQESVFMCGACFREEKHPEHDKFMYREAPSGKWIPVAANRCVPTNLGHVLRNRVGPASKREDPLLESKWIHSIDEIQTLRTCDLARLPHWTIRQPRNRSGRASAFTSRRGSDSNAPGPAVDFCTMLMETAEQGKLDGPRARLANWGSLMTSGLLAPGRQCLICLMAFRLGDVVRRLTPGCEHIFHVNCIDPWLMHRSASCPLDGTRVVPVNTDSNTSTRVMQRTQESRHDRLPFEGIQISAYALFTRPIKQSVISPGRRIPLPVPRTNSLNSAALDVLSVVGQSAASINTRATKSSNIHVRRPQLS